MRDGFSLCVLELKRLILDKHHKLLDPAKKQLFWLLTELVKLKVTDVDTLIAAMMRHIVGGDVSGKNINFITAILRLLIDHKYVPCYVFAT